MLSIRYIWSNTPQAQALGFGRAGCFALELNGVPLKGFDCLDEAAQEYTRLRAAINSGKFKA